jgi:PhnB protein
MPALEPQLSVRRGREAVEFYKDAFGAREVYRVGGTDEHEPVVALLDAGGARFWVSDEAPDQGNFSPESLGGGTVRLTLIVDDPEPLLTRAVELGAAELAALHDEHGWRLGRIRDPFGHPWEIGHPLGAWPPPGGRPALHAP